MRVRDRLFGCGTLIASLLVAQPVCFGQPDVETAKREVTRAHEKVTAAWKRHDLKAHLAMLADDFTSVAVDGAARSHADAIARIRELHRNVRVARYRSDIEKLEMKGKKAVIVAHITAAGKTLNGKTNGSKWLPYTRDVRSRITYVKTANGWKQRKQESLPGGQETIDGKPIKATK